jgi:hypothetical protein
MSALIARAFVLAIIAATDAGVSRTPQVEQASPSEDVRIVVFRATDGAFWKARLDGKNLADAVRIPGLGVRDASDLALSPDGNALAYTRTGAQGKSTEVFNFQTGATTSLVPLSAGESYGPTWSSDGLQVGVHIHDGRMWDVALVNRFGGNIKRLHLREHGWGCDVLTWVDMLVVQAYCIGDGRLRALRLQDDGVELGFEKVIPGSSAIRSALAFSGGLDVLLETLASAAATGSPPSEFPRLAVLTWPNGTPQVAMTSPSNLASRSPQGVGGMQFLFLGVPLSDGHGSQPSNNTLPSWNLYLGDNYGADATIVHERVSDFSVSLRSHDPFLLARLAFEADQQAVFTRADCSGGPSPRMYFPVGALSDQRRSDEFRSQWYSKNLQAMGEPSLSCRVSSSEGYRFLWLRTWGHPVAIRVDVAGNRRLLTATELDGAGGYGPGKALRQSARELTDGEWRRISSALKRSDFWATPTTEHQLGFDGARWVLEGRSGTRYHVVDRWSPTHGPFRDLCLLLQQMGAFPGQSQTQRGGAR